MGHFDSQGRIVSPLDASPAPPSRRIEDMHVGRTFSILVDPHHHTVCCYGDRAVGSGIKTRKRNYICTEKRAWTITAKCLDDGSKTTFNLGDLVIAGLEHNAPDGTYAKRKGKE